MKYRDLKLNFTIEDTQFTIVSICLEKLPLLIPLHSHSNNSYEIHYISYGYGTLRTDGATYPVGPGTLFVTGPGIEHEQISVPETPMHEYCVYLKLSRTGRGSKKATPLMSCFTAQPFWFGAGDEQTGGLMAALIRELEAGQEGYDTVLPALLQQLIVHLVRRYREAEGSTARPEAAPSSPADLTYLTIEEAFLYNYSSITLETLAHQLGLSPRQTERLLQLHYHKTFLQKKTEARMSAACSLLRGTSASVSTISEELGYSSVEHFSTAFRKYHSMTPSEFRRRSTEAAM